MESVRLLIENCLIQFHLVFSDQLPIFLGMYRAVLSLPDLLGHHFVWISNLAAPDTLYLLPLVVALTTYWQMKSNPGSTRPNGVASASLSKIVPVVNFVFMATLPGAIVLYYATSGAFQLLANSALRRWLG